MARGRRWRVALAVLAVLVTVIAPGPAQGQEEPAPPERTIAVEPTTWRQGDTLTLSGTGCIDPGTGSGAGLFVVIPGGGPFATPVPVAGDGSFSATRVYDRPILGTGFPLLATCTNNPDSPQNVPGFVFDFPRVAVDVVPSPFTVVSEEVVIGGRLRFVSPCDPGGAADVTLEVFYAPPPPLPRYDLARAAGPFARGAVVEVPVPAGLVPEQYLLRLSCGTGEGDDSLGVYVAGARLVAAPTRSAPPVASRALPATG